MWTFVTDFFHFFFFFFFFFCFLFFSLAVPWHMEFLGQGSDLSHGCNLSLSCNNAGSFNPLCRARDQTCRDAADLVLICPSLSWVTAVSADSPDFFNHLFNWVFLFYDSFFFFFLFFLGPYRWHMEVPRLRAESEL